MNSYNGFSGAQRMRGFNWLKGEIAARRRNARPTMCDACGQTAGHLEWHSEDYSEPFGPHIGAYGLCFVCHMMLHCRSKSPDKWQTYRQFVREGATYPPLTGRDWHTFRARYLVADTLPEPATWRDPPARHVLDEIDAHTSD